LQATEKKSPPKAQWSSQSIGKRWQHYFFYLVIRFFGRHPAYVFMYLVSFWYILFSPLVRQRCRYYLDHRFPKRTALLQRFIDNYRLIISFGEMLIDRAAFGILGDRCFQVTFPKNQELLDLMAEDKGLIFINCHVGCWQVALSALKYLQTKVSIGLYQDQADIDRQYFEHSGEAPPFSVIDPAGYLGGVLEMVQVLQNKGALGLMGDRVFGSHENSVEAKFLEGIVKLPVGPYRLASMQETPVALLFSYKTGYGMYTVELATIIRPPANAGRKPEAYAACAQELADALSTFTSEHPWHFFNFHNMWKQE